MFPERAVLTAEARAKAADGPLRRLSRDTLAGAKLGRPVELVCFALLVAHAVYLARVPICRVIWIVAPDGSGVQSDFVNVWAAGRMVLAGHAGDGL